MGDRAMHPRTAHADAECSPPGAPVDQERIRKAVREILLAVGEDPDREGLRETPARVARMYAEMFSGLRARSAQLLQQDLHREVRRDGARQGHRL